MTDNMQRLKQDWKDKNPKQKDGNMFFKPDHWLLGSLHEAQVPLIKTDVSVSE